MRYWQSGDPETNYIEFILDSTGRDAAAAVSLDDSAFIRECNGQKKRYTMQSLFDLELFHPLHFGDAA